MTSSLYFSPQISLQTEPNQDGEQSFESINQKQLILSIFQYWGWCKYHYREEPKANFLEAKERMVQCLDTCPPDVI